MTKKTAGEGAWDKNGGKWACFEIGSGKKRMKKTAKIHVNDCAARGTKERGEALHRQNQLNLFQKLCKKTK